MCVGLGRYNVQDDRGESVIRGECGFPLIYVFFFQWRSWCFVKKETELEGSVLKCTGCAVEQG